MTGIERRSAHVYGQWWLPGMQGVRTVFPALVALAGPREMRRVEPLLTSSAGGAGRPGGGGRRGGREGARRGAAEPR
ncbi:hypothetical protein GCM10020000_47700 [Streptomyces olivoverticillatus]